MLKMSTGRMFFENVENVEKVENAEGSYVQPENVETLKKSIWSKPKLAPNSSTKNLYFTDIIKNGRRAQLSTFCAAPNHFLSFFWHCTTTTVP